jgi:predicted RNA-binding Zn-ribbon protein involved in translation (DUF1610 family)
MNPAEQFDQSYDRVKYLRDVLFGMKNGVAEVEKVLQQEEEALKDICGKIGHTFVAESDYDCHKPGYYYTCSKCGFWTKTKPTS